MDMKNGKNMMRIMIVFMIKILTDMKNGKIIYYLENNIQKHNLKNVLDLINVKY